MSNKYAVIIFIEDENDEFTRSEIRDMFQENILEYTDNAPVSILALKVEKL